MGWSLCITVYRGALKISCRNESDYSVLSGNCKIDANISVLAGLHSCWIGCIGASTRQSVAVLMLTTICCAKRLVTVNCNVVKSCLCS
jgi:hypothetical protein